MPLPANWHGSPPTSSSAERHLRHPGRWIGATTGDSFPVLVRRLIPDASLAALAEQLGTWRNRVKHRRQTELADRVVDQGAEIAWRIALQTAGAYVDPVSVMVRAVEADPSLSFRPPPMRSRRGTARRPHR